MSKKGQGAMGIVVIICAVILIVIAIASLTGFSSFLSNMGLSADQMGGIGTAIVSTFTFIKDLVVPVSAGLSDDQMAIAFAMFLLVWLIGTRALTQAFNNNWFIAFLVAGLVSAIASRSLTPELISQYISPSPVAASAFLIGILPIFAFFGIMKKWKPSNSPDTRILLKFMAWALLAATYWAVFAFAFDSRTLGFIYFICIILAGLCETLLPYYRYKKLMAHMKTTGKGLAEFKAILAESNEAVKAFNESEFSDLSGNLR
jgi:hypothetical protein